MLDVLFLEVKISDLVSRKLRSQQCPRMLPHLAVGGEDPVPKHGEEIVASGRTQLKIAKLGRQESLDVAWLDRPELHVAHDPLLPCRDAHVLLELFEEIGHLVFLIGLDHIENTADAENVRRRSSWQICAAMSMGSSAVQEAVGAFFGDEVEDERHHQDRHQGQGGDNIDEHVFSDAIELLVLEF